MAYRLKVDEPSKIRETLERAFASPIGTVEFDVPPLTYQVLQFNVAETLENQKYDVYSVDKVLGKQVTFNELIMLLADDMRKQGGFVINELST